MGLFFIIYLFLDNKGLHKTTEEWASVGKISKVSFFKKHQYHCTYLLQSTFNLNKNYKKSQHPNLLSANSSHLLTRFSDEPLTRRRTFVHLQTNMLLKSVSLLHRDNSNVDQYSLKKKNLNITQSDLKVVKEDL